MFFQQGNESILFSFCHTIFHQYLYTLDFVLKYQLQGQAGASRKSTFSNGCHAVGDGDRGQAGASIKSTPSNCCHAVGDGDRGQAGAFIKSFISNACHAVGDGDRGQAGASRKSRTSNGRHAVGDGDRGQAGASIKIPIVATGKPSISAGISTVSAFLSHFEILNIGIIFFIGQIAVSASVLSPLRLLSMRTAGNLPVSGGLSPFRTP